MAEHRERPNAAAHPFLCECGDPRCLERLVLTPAAYDASHEPTLAPGHRVAPGRRAARPGTRAREP